MKINQRQFENLLHEEKLIITLIGMSNIGKTFWSKKLSQLGFSHLNCDCLIEAMLGPQLKNLGYKGISDMVQWLGPPDKKKFKVNQKKYLDLEGMTVKKIYKKLTADVFKNTVIDTTGSFICLDQSLCHKIKQISIVIYLEATTKLQDKMLENFFKFPKPLIWKDKFQPKNNENSLDALKRCYPLLLQYRHQKYCQVADIIIPKTEIKDTLKPEGFLNLIKTYL